MRSSVSGVATPFVFISEIICEPCFTELAVSLIIAGPTFGIFLAAEIALLPSLKPGVPRSDKAEIVSLTTMAVSILDKSEPIEVSGPDIVFEINSSLDFHVSMIGKNRDIINEILSEEYGIGTSFKVLKGSEKNNKSSVEQVLTDSTDSEQDEKVRDKVVDLFDGEILT